jgi:hypothetical protein
MLTDVSGQRVRPIERLIRSLKIVRVASIELLAIGSTVFLEEPLFVLLMTELKKICEDLSTVFFNLFYRKEDVSYYSCCTDSTPYNALQI